VTVDELEKCVGLLIDLARSRGVREVDVGEADLYWSVPSPDWVDMAKHPNVVVGDFGDDVAELQKMLQDPGRACSVDFDRVAALLRVVSDRLSR
jgi:hypothetical protein